MRQRIRKKRKEILKNRGSSGKLYHHLLHSDKSTYFYKTPQKVFTRLSSLIAPACLVALLGLGLALINPNTESLSTAYALEETNAGGDIPTSGVSLKINTTLPSDNTITKLVNDKGTNYITVDFSVGANKVSEYSVYVQANSTALTGLAQGDIIQSINTNLAGASLGDKTWGVSVAEGTGHDPAAMTYTPVQTGVSTPAAKMSAASGGELTNIDQAYTLAFAANLNGAKADHYKSNIVLSVAMNAKEVVEFAGFDNIIFMQDMTPEVCNTETIGATKRLVDMRDHKYYWVTKQADGNCWMTQNLDFDIPATLSSTTSDVTGANVSTGISESTMLANWSTSDTANQYYDPGDYYYNGPDGNHAQSGDRCEISGLNNETLSECKYFSTIGDEHYHIGNYYSFNAVTAKSGDILINTGENATQSICPKGWQLPLSGKDIVDFTDATVPWNESKTFARLFEDYGWRWDKIYYANNLNGGTNYDIYKAPFYFMFGGAINGETLGSAGYTGYYWSSTIRDESLIFRLVFSLTTYPAGSTPRYAGHSVRCVAR